MNFFMKILNLIAIHSVLGCLRVKVEAQAICKINIDQTAESFNRPFLIAPESRQVLYPEIHNDHRLIIVPPGTRLVIACPGKKNALSLTNEKSTEATCYDGQLVSSSAMDSKVLKFEDLGCLRRPRPSLSLVRNSVCGEAGTRYNIGWKVRTDLFVPMLHFCFNKEKEITEFTFHKVQGRSIDNRIIDSSRPTFRAGGLYTVDVRKIYRKKSQKALFKELLGTHEHLSGRGQHYLARGHMAPDSDFFYTAEQDATYFYANAVPQWQAFNNGNWKRLEFAIRELAEKHWTTLEIWTGAYGVLQLPDVNNNFVSMFLGLTEGKRVAQVPALLWKVVYDPSIRQAVAVVSVNDVRGDGRAEGTPQAGPPCPDICHQITWIDWDTNDIRRGRTFCCHVSDLRSTIPTLPDLGHVGLLDK